MDVAVETTLTPTDVLVVPVFVDESLGRAPLAPIDAGTGGRLSEMARSGMFSARFDTRAVNGPSVQSVLLPGSDLAARWVLAVGAGERSRFDAHRARVVAGVAARQTRSGIASVTVLLRSRAHAEATVDGFVTGAYGYREPTVVDSLTLLHSSPDASFARGRVVGESVNGARDLVNAPANVLTPSALAQRATDMLEPLGVDVHVLRGDAIAQLGGLRAVTQGSAEAPAFITMRWTPRRARDKPVLGLAGKGITFDSGGLNIKPGDGMRWMKGDMAGGAAVIASLQAISTLQVPVRVVAAVPAAENMPSGSAVRVGDVITHHCGKTSEVANTDCEGRLVLADSLSWLGEQGATHLVDVATLTYSIISALGNVAFGVIGRPDVWVNAVVRTARKAGERAWQLPLYDEYRGQICSEVADVKNLGDGGAGAITAAWFLSEFVPPDLCWAHLDIDGVAWAPTNAYRPAGATGAAVRTLVRIAEDLAS